MDWATNTESIISRMLSKIICVSGVKYGSAHSYSFFKKKRIFFYNPTSVIREKLLWKALLIGLKIKQNSFCAE